MTKFIYLITFLAATSSFICSDNSCLGGLIYDDSLTKVYTKINDYLVDMLLQERDPEKNLIKAIEWLESKPKRGLFSTNSYPEALRQLKNLKSLKDDLNCDSKSLTTMKENDRATNFKANWSKKFLEPLRRIDQVVRYYSEEHAKSCREIYLNTFRAKHSELRDKPDIQLVESFVEGQILGTIEFGKNDFKEFNWIPGHIDADKLGTDKSHIKYAMKRKTFESPQVYDAICHFAKHDPELVFMKPVLDERKGAMIVREDKVEALYRKYFARPCEYYVQQFGPEILEVAAYDSKMLDDEEYDDTKRVLSNLDYYIGRFSYDICHSLSYRGGKTLNELKKIVANRSN